MRSSVCGKRSRKSLVASASALSARWGSRSGSARAPPSRGTRCRPRESDPRARARGAPPPVGCPGNPGKLTRVRTHERSLETAKQRSLETDVGSQHARSHAPRAAGPGVRRRVRRVRRSACRPTSIRCRRTLRQAVFRSGSRRNKRRVAQAKWDSELREARSSGAMSDRCPSSRDRRGVGSAWTHTVIANVLASPVRPSPHVARRLSWM